MASLRKLRRRLAAWERYDTRNQAVAGGWACAALPAGLERARDAVRREKHHRGLLLGQRYTPTCYDCGLPDPYRGLGDGIGSCDCPRCQDCGAGPELCDCRDWPGGWDDDEDGAGCASDCSCWGQPGRVVETIAAAGGVL